MKVYRKYLSEGTIEEITLDEAIKKLKGYYKDIELIKEALKDGQKLFTVSACYTTDKLKLI